MSKFYSKEKIIGSGSFGNVWLVKSKTNNNYYVLKELNLSTMNATETQHALTEVTVLSRCRHRYIIRYKDAVIDHKKGLLSLIMEYAEGGDLYTAITKQEGVPFKEYNIMRWFTQICLALQYIHHKSILHRDLKTRNIFLTRDKQIKVGDFGIARCLMETNDLATTAIGTPYYLSPEICTRKPYSYKSDIWALGCVLFEIATLSHPFQACNFPHLLTLIVTGQRKELPGNCSLLVKELVDLLLKENPEDRPSADEILAMPSLQPYLSEVWILQNDTSSSLSKKFNEKMSLRRYSSTNSGKILAEMEVKRRASVSSADSSVSKRKLGFVNKLKNAAIQKTNHSPRTHNVKEQKFPARRPVMSDPFSTYKISDSLSFKRSKISINGMRFLHQKKTPSKIRIDSKSSPENDESDRGYQSDEILKSGIWGKLSGFSTKKTSTKKHFDTPDFQIEESIFNDEVFHKSFGKPASSQKPANNGHDIAGCCHSQCQQCMLDMLWKNRIKGVIGPMTQSNERTELVRKLQMIFGIDLFDDVYHSMISNWDASENNQSPKCIRDIASSLNYTQLQNMPLMMQLIQLDLVPK